MIDATSPAGAPLARLEGMSNPWFIKHFQGENVMIWVL